MEKLTTHSYRDRLYKKYITSGSAGLAPAQAADLAPRLPYLRNVVRKFFPTNKNCAVLDLGCGYGALLYVAKIEGYENLNGIDVSAEQVAAARKLGMLQVQQYDIFSFIELQPSNSCDVLIAFDVIEHLTKPEVMRFIDQAYRILKSGGRWIVHVPNGESPFVGRILFGDFTHEQAFTHRSLTSLFKASGFDEVRCFEDMPIVHGFKSFLRHALWRVVRIVLRLYVIIETGDLGKNAIFSQNFLSVASKK